MYSQFDIQKVKDAADIRDYVPGLSGRGASRYCKCPECGKSGKDKGLIVTHKRGMDMARCFSCGFTLTGSIDALKYFQGLSFIEAVKTIAADHNIRLLSDDEKRIETVKKNPESSFCNRQLQESGLTVSDVIAKVPVIGEEGRFDYISPFRKGQVRADGKIDENADEMLIQYFDLYGHPVEYATRGGAGARRRYIRMRWSNPELHKVGDGKAMKYQTPKGAPAKFYIPQKIRDYFAESTPIETLIIQEGEKKAEKGCKHGIPSVGIQGIYNIGNKESGLIQDLQYLVERCRIKNIVLLMDSDWNHLSKDIKDGDAVDGRPMSFAGAVIKFKQYVNTLNTLGLNVDIWWGHINDNEKGDKGIDDLLCNTLLGKEDLLKEDIYKTMHSHDGRGEYADVHKISVASDFRIFDYWALNNKDDFFKSHEKEIAHLEKFQFKRVWYIREDGEIKKQGINGGAKEFWELTKEVNESSGKVKRKIAIDYKLLIDFININGFRLISNPEHPLGGNEFIRVEKGIRKKVSVTQIQRFVLDYVKQSTQDSFTLSYFMEKFCSIVTEDRLKGLDIETDEGYVFEELRQYYNFRNCEVAISAYEITENNATANKWDQQIIKHDFKRTPIFEHITYDKALDEYSFKFTPEGERCDFMRYLMNTSRPFGSRIEEMKLDEHQRFVKQTLNKCSCLGYLLHFYRPRTELKAVVAMDGQESEVGQSRGRTGKSIIGTAVKAMMSQVFIDGKKLRNDDEFIFSLVTMDTRNIFIDDVRVNFDFETLFAAITGDLNVNPKGLQRFVIPLEKSPKILITTNHAVRNMDDSTRARIQFMEFSNWYSYTRTPKMEFGHGFFEQGWDYEQWNLFYNLMLECVQLYLRKYVENWDIPGEGMITPPMEEIQTRILRQEIGEVFLQWAEVYFDISGSNINHRIKRKEMYDDFQRENPGCLKIVTPANFLKKLEKYCEYAGLHLNPTKPSKETGELFTDFKGRSFIGQADKSNSIEYFTVATSDGDGLSGHLVSEIISTPPGGTIETLF